MNSHENNTEIPQGLSMALAQNLEAMSYFASLDEDGRKRVVERTHAIRSKEEMQAYVQTLSENKSG